jgi:putative membrane protein
MDPETYNWLRVGHVFGFVCWIGGLVTVLLLLRVHGVVEGPAREVLGRQERKAAVLMDVGATIAIVCGLWMALGAPVNAFKTGAWLHVKLTLVAIFLFGMHGWARVQIRKFRDGKVRHVSSKLIVVVLLAVAAIIALGANPDLLRKGA